MPPGYSMIVAVKMTHTVFYEARMWPQHELLRTLTIETMSEYFKFWLAEKEQKSFYRFYIKTKA